MKNLTLIFAFFCCTHSYSQVYIPMADTIDYGVIINDYTHYFDSLNDEGVILDSLFEYREFMRTKYALQYNGGFPNFTYQQLANVNNDWISANAGNWGCKINS